MEKKDKQPTIKEIAKKLKISTSTVSRALKDHPSIGLVTTMRVKKVAEELGYEPNQTAIFFKQRKTFTIGIILPSISEAFFSAAISEIEHIANEHRYTVILGQTADDPDREMQVIEAMKKHRVDGIILSAAKNTTEYAFLPLLENAGIPIVFFDCVPNMEGVYAVLSDLKAGLHDAIDLLVSCGHSRIALINGPSSLPASLERYEGYLEGLEKHHLHLYTEYVEATDLSESRNLEAMERLIDLPNRPSAVILFNDYVTLDAINACRKRNVVINQDIFFVSFANFPYWKYMDNPPMASIEQLPGEQAIIAANKLFALIDQPNLPYERIVLKSKLVKSL
ncbi:LacI family DNA-binding transcriptional regulator [Olivibacter sitiensis]|uniref:LacI family DNA-binding transcriptional regulator n=1 Tax=Olivibacter sitiensis TaxID=376470 RepID=UPI00040E27C2|nr:LacI family DNA-binding transcriptional regulator [Olivibacter sitiensis]